jgi:hypothetical protein
VWLPEPVPAGTDLRERRGELPGGQVRQSDVAQTWYQELLDVARV